MNHPSSKKNDEKVSQTKIEVVIEDMGLDYMKELFEMEEMILAGGPTIQTKRDVLLKTNIARLFSNSDFSFESIRNALTPGILWKR